MISVSQLSEISSEADLEQIRRLYLSNGWIEASDGETDALIEKIVSRTFCFAVAREEGGIIGMGRAVADGVSDAYIQDVTVLAEYRKRGVGGQIIRFLVANLQSRGIGWIGLISEPGYESFYEGQGFSVMQSYTPFIYKGKGNPRDGDTQ